MKARSWWVELSADNAMFNFMWKPFSQGIDFEEINNSSIPQVVNHFENHRELSRKSNLFINLQEFAEVTIVIIVVES